MEQYLIGEINLINALIAGVGIAVIAATIGCFVVWRRMAYFGDSLAHSSLLGIALGIIVGISVNIGIIIACLLFAIFIVWLQQKKILATDTLLGIMAHSSLAIGMVALSLTGNEDFDLHDYMLGDISSVTMHDIYWIYGVGAIIMLVMARIWQSLLLMTINEDIAIAEGVNIFRNNLLLMLAMTLMVAVSINIVGVLLITAMLIIPAATARQMASSPTSMAIFSAIIGIISVAIGIFCADYYSIPAGHSIVTSSTVIFLIMLLPSAIFIRR